MFTAITQEFSKNLLKIKVNSSSFGFAIQELPSEEAISTVLLTIPLCIVFTLHFVPQRLSKKFKNLKF